MGAADRFLAFPLVMAVVDGDYWSDVADKDQRCCVTPTVNFSVKT